MGSLGDVRLMPLPALVADSIGTRPSTRISGW